MRVEVPRVVRRAVGRVLRRRAHRELVHVGLAEDDHAGLAQSARDGRVVRRPPALEDLRAARRRHALGRDDVLERERHAGQRAELARRPRGVVDGLRGGQRAVGVDVQERVDPVVDRGDAVEVRLRDLDGADVSPQAIARRRLGGGQPGQVRSRRSRLLVEDARAPGTGRPRRPARRRAPPPGSGPAAPRRRGRRWSAAARATSAGCRRRRPRRPARPTPRITSSWPAKWSSSSSVRASRASRARCATSARVIVDATGSVMGRPLLAGRDTVT